MERDVDRDSHRLMKFLAAVSLLSVAISAHAQPDAGHSEQEQQGAGEVTLKDFSGRFDLSIPQSPAFTILGLSPENVVKSDDYRKAAATILRGLDGRGNLQSGLALDVRPFLSMLPNTPTLLDYRDHWWVRLATQAKVSFATASGQDDADRADRQALGLSLTLWMENDPARGGGSIDYVDPDGTTRQTGSLDQCYAVYLLAAAQAPDQFPSDEDLTQAEAEIAEKARKAIAQCLEPYKKKYWNSGSLTLNLAGYRGKVDDVDANGDGWALAFSHSIGERGQVVLRASASDDQLQPVEGMAGEYTLVDEKGLGARFRWGSAQSALMVEAMYTDADTTGTNESYWRAALGTEFLLGKDTWLQIAVGRAFSTDMFDDDPVFSGQVRFGFSETSLFSR